MEKLLRDPIQRGEECKLSGKESHLNANFMWMSFFQRLSQWSIVLLWWTAEKTDPVKSNADEAHTSLRYARRLHVSRTPQV